MEDAVITGIRHIDIVLVVNKDAGGQRQTVYIGTKLAELAQIAAIGVEDEDAVVFRVGDVNTPGAITGNVWFVVDGKVASPTFHRPFPDRGEIRGELLHTAVPRIRHIHKPIRVYGHPHRLIEKAQIAARHTVLPANLPQEIAIPIHDLDAVIARVGDEHTAVVHQHNITRPKK